MLSLRSCNLELTVPLRVVTASGSQDSNGVAMKQRHAWLHVGCQPKSSGLVLLCTAVHQCTESALERCPLCCEARRLKWSACKLVPQPVLAVGQTLLPVGLCGTLYSASGALCDTLLCATNMLQRSGCGPTGRPARPLPSGPCSSLTQQVPEPLRCKTLPPPLGTLTLQPVAPVQHHTYLQLTGL